MFSESNNLAKQEASVKDIAIFVGFLLGLFFDPEDGSDMLLRNVLAFFKTIEQIITTGVTT
jgi:hypothetical protein